MGTLLGQKREPERISAQPPQEAEVRESTEALKTQKAAHRDIVIGKRYKENMARLLPTLKAIVEHVRKRGKMRNAWSNGMLAA